MYCKDSGRRFRDYKVDYNDIMYIAITEQNAEDFTDRINNEIDNIVKQGFKVVGLSYRMEVDGFMAIIEYAHEKDIYYDTEGSEISNGTE